jgi:hypothetical protein
MVFELITQRAHVFPGFDEQILKLGNITFQNLIISHKRLEDTRGLRVLTRLITSKLKTTLSQHQIPDNLERNANRVLEGFQTRTCLLQHILRKVCTRRAKVVHFLTKRMHLVLQLR